MNWSYFASFALIASLCWGAGAILAWKGRHIPWVYGLAVFFFFIIALWGSLERPPMRTMGETRLWYVFFLPLAGLLTYIRWHYKWILSFSFVLSFVFICINLKFRKC